MSLGFRVLAPKSIETSTSFKRNIWGWKMRFDYVSFETKIRRQWRFIRTFECMHNYCISLQCKPLMRSNWHQGSFLYITRVHCANPYHPQDWLHASYCMLFGNLYLPRDQTAGGSPIRDLPTCQTSGQQPWWLSCWGAHLGELGSYIQPATFRRYPLYWHWGLCFQPSWREQTARWHLNQPAWTDQ